ncbi:MAG: DNA polymerase III subunit alpha [Firmicutes bacterium]|nr:DNA polymerase III subunit alpha [Bacillota bacterium]
MHPPLTDVASSFSLGRSLWTVEDLVRQLHLRGFRQACLTDWETLAGTEAFDRLMREAHMVPWVGVSFALEVRGTPREVRLIATDERGWPRLVNFRAAVRDPAPGTQVVLGADNEPWWASEPEWLERPDVVVELQPHQRDWALRLPSGWRWVPHCRVRLAHPSDAVALGVLAQVVGVAPEVGAEALPASPDEWLAPYRDWPQDRLWQPESTASVFSDRGWKLPRFGGQDEAALLRSLAERGLAERYRGQVPPQARARLARELEVITSLGFSGYFLIVQDLVGWARRHSIRVGPGRGSAAASLVSYALGITAANPLEYGLVFERFLNPARRNWPDIDLDFEDARRGEVIQYLRTRHGTDRVAQVGTYGTLAARAALREVGRALGIDPARVSAVMERMEWGPHDRLADHLAALTKAARAYGMDDRWIVLARRLEGLPRLRSIHAAGVIVAPTPLSQSLLCHGDARSGWVTDFDMDALERLGFVKLDILGLRTLSLVAKLEDALGIQESSLATVPDRDSETLRLLARGDTDGVFQLDGRGVKTLLRQMKPKSRDEVMVVLALYRPGPMEAIGEFLARRQRGYQASDDNPWEAWCAETFGIMVYQEQLMAAIQGLAGVSWAEADLVRRAISKKDHALLERQGERLRAQMIARGYRPAQAERFWEQVQAFGDYGFNKAHAVSYGLLSYYLAYLKAHYPLHFWMAQLAIHDHSDKLKEVMRVVVSQGIEILPPHVNHSLLSFTVENQAIRAGLGIIRGVSADQAAAIWEERRRGGPYRDARELRERVGYRIGGRTLELLSQTGALAGLGRLTGTQMTLFEEEAAEASGDPVKVAWHEITGFGWPMPDGPIYVRLDGDARMSAVTEQLGALKRKHPGPVPVEIIKDSRKALVLRDLTLSGHWTAIEDIKRIPGVLAAGRPVAFRR